MKRREKISKLPHSIQIEINILLHSLIVRHDLRTILDKSKIIDRKIMSEIKMQK